MNVTIMNKTEDQIQDENLRMAPDLLRIGEAADLASVTVPSLIDWLRRHQRERPIIDKVKYVQKSDLVDYINDRVQRGLAKPLVYKIERVMHNDPLQPLDEAITKLKKTQVRLNNQMTHATSRLAWLNAEIVKLENEGEQLVDQQHHAKEQYEEVTRLLSELEEQRHELEH